jgi:ABC-type proline/glycine betaine transport system substrate-binding protein
LSRGLLVIYDVLPEYGLEDDWTVTESSGAAMAAALSTYKNEEPIASALESVGFDVTLTQVDAGPMWAGVASGSGDAAVGAWLPTTHADYYEQYEGDFEDLGSNLHGTALGLVVPTYMDIDSIEDLVVE